MEKKETVLVKGSSGFVGAQIVLQLLQILWRSNLFPTMCLSIFPKEPLVVMMAEELTF